MNQQPSNLNQQQKISAFIVTCFLVFGLALVTGFSVFHHNDSESGRYFSLPHALNSSVEISAPSDSGKLQTVGVLLTKLLAEEPALVAQAKPASHFTHHQQQAAWQSLALFPAPKLRLMFSFQPDPATHRAPWYMRIHRNKSRLSGWKDSNLNYRYIDAFV
ncbi:hypothetical protein ACFSJY_14300 [Thalassotalea euphylliae]|uniref:hypothetical protein n=1 Tax=Thalassotalea euphylliae TaxID=1655234 RepID=UPI00362DC60E